MMPLPEVRQLFASSNFFSAEKMTEDKMFVCSQKSIESEKQNFVVFVISDMQ